MHDVIVTKSSPFLHNDVSCKHSNKFTCAVKSISVVSMIAFTPVATGRVTGTHVRCNPIAGGMLVTCTRCIRSTLPWINVSICMTHVYIHTNSCIVQLVHKQIFWLFRWFPTSFILCIVGEVTFLTVLVLKKQLVYNFVRKKTEKDVLQ